jgi:plasmid stabilization system protein ParE
VFRVRLSDAAQSDIRSNVTWWSENRSREEAERWYMAVMEKIYSLEQLPLRCPIARESEILGIEIRHLLFGISSKHTHRVLFTMDGNFVKVIRVLSTSQDTSDFSSLP